MSDLWIFGVRKPISDVNMHKTFTSASTSDLCFFGVRKPISDVNTPKMFTSTNTVQLCSFACLFKTTHQPLWVISVRRY